MQAILNSSYRLLSMTLWLLLSTSSLTGCLSEQDSTRNKSPLDSHCLLQEQVCQWQDSNFSESQWQVRLEQEANHRLFKLTVIAPKSFQEDSLIMTWRGLDMYLGVYPRRLDYQKSTAEARIYTTEMSLPLCSVDTSMPWQLELSRGKTLIEAPFTLVYVRP